MAVPGYQEFMLPLLEFLADGREHPMKECRAAMAERFHLAPDEIDARLPSGTQTVFANRVGWAKTYLLKAGLVQSPRRGVVRLTKRGRQVLEERPERVDTGFLERFAEFREFRSRQRNGRTTADTADDAPREVLPEDLTAEETIERAFSRHREALATELLDLLRDMDPTRFEQLVVDLLVRMGYGGSHREAARAVGRSGDEGIDGIINEDRLGLDVVYIQAKRWNRPVGRPEIQRFAGALQGHRARKGVFITTSTFTREARDYAGKIDARIILVDGESLAELMIEHGLGVVTTTTYELKRLDRDYFEPEE